MATAGTASSGARFERQRAQSISSDRPSTTGYGGLVSPPAMTAPSPIYIATSAASQIVTNDHDSHSNSWFDQHGIEPSGETALVAPGALKLVNDFLDQLLFNFLSISKSTSLASLRPAVGEVLKPKLAREAIGLADQELHEYLGGGEDEELLAFHNGLEPVGDWDLELVWKRTRLRCMVYSSLGDMEEEDEDYYTELEHLDGPSGSTNHFSPSMGVVSPAVAIFLTSILEFMGEQALVVAGQAAYHRLRAKYEKDERDGTTTPHDIADRVEVDEMDMERVALDRTLGRLWRGWKKRIRSPTVDSAARPFSRDSAQSRGNSRRGSLGNEPQMPMIEPGNRKASLTAVMPFDHPASIALPMGEQDIREIEIPGLAIQSDDERSIYAPDEESKTKRPKSFVIFTREFSQLPTPNSSRPQTPTLLMQHSRKRAYSLPSPVKSHHNSPFKKQKGSNDTPADLDGVNNTSVDHKTDSPPMDPMEPINDDEPRNLVAPKLNESGHETKEIDMGEGPLAEDTIPEELESDEVVQSDDHHGGIISGIAAGTAAIVTAAATAIAAAAKGNASKADTSKEDNADSDEEEPEIMTSSRVSVQGRHSPDNRAVSRASSVRSHSVRSLRLVDVHPLTRSRQNSLDGVGGMRPAALSRSGSVISSAVANSRPSSPETRSGTSSPHLRNSAAKSNLSPGRSLAGSISEIQDRSFAGTNYSNAPIALPERSPLRDLQTAAITRSPTFSDASPSPRLQPTVTPPRSQDPSFVLAPAPLPKTSRETSLSDSSHAVTNAPFSRVQNAAPGMIAVSGLKASTSEHGAPPLTPLREMMEGAQDTSDDASSIAHSSDGRSLSETHVTSLYHPSGSSPIERKAAQTYFGERSTSMAGATQQVPREDDVTPRPDTRGKSQPRTHTSGSSGSSTTSRIKPHRTSEESVPSGADKSRSFEQLIQSDQTIQYTLTPENMRQIESHDLRQNQLPMLPAPPFTNGFDHSKPRVDSRHSVSKFTGLNSNPPPGKPRVLSPTATEFPKNFPLTPTNGSRVRPVPPQARDARVDRQSMGDFSDFIRSTGPTGTYAPTPPRVSSMANTSSPIADTHPPVPTLTRGSGRTGSVAAARSGAIAIAPKPRRTNSLLNRARLEARDPVVPQRDNTSELIDFIRQGPPKSASPENPRIIRTGASFRTTSDSDQMTGAVGARLTDTPDLRSSVASTSVSNEQISMHSSINSQSALLNTFRSEYKTDAKGDLRPDYKTTKPATSKKQIDFDEEDMMPKKKTRRVRDPYAIDLSDEDEELFADFAPKPKREEESLIDFLNNVPPPASSTVEAAPKPVSKRSSASGLMSTFRNSTAGPPPKIASSSNSRSGSRKDTGAPQIPPHVPIATKYSSQNDHTEAASFSPRRGNYVSQLDTERNPATKVTQKPFQPREAVTSIATTRTSDLAEFLLNTPPPSTNHAHVQPLQLNREPVKEEQRFSRMFGRKKKIGAS